MYKAVKQDDEQKAPIKRFDVKEGDTIYMYTDGTGDNLTVDEVISLTQGLQIEKQYQKIVTTVRQRMESSENLLTETSDAQRKKVGTYGDGFKSKPKRDNMGLTIIEIE